MTSADRAMHGAGHPRPAAPSAARRRAEPSAGWLFVAPVLVILGLFLLVPVLMAAWVSVTRLERQGSPFAGPSASSAADNYTERARHRAACRRGTSGPPPQQLWYVVLVVPAADRAVARPRLLVNRKVLRGRGFFRTAFYFPSVTSSVAISVLFLFLFAGSGAVNKLLATRHQRPELVRRPARRAAHPARAVGVDRRPGRADRARRSCRHHLVGVARRAERGDERVHHPGGLDHLRHVHAAVPRRAAEHLRRGRGGGDDGRRERLAAVPARHAADAASRRCSSSSRSA